MKIKKWMVVLGVILISISQGNVMGNSRTFFNGGFSIIRILALVFSQIISGFFIFMNQLIHFSLSWQGVLLLAVILIHINVRKYFNHKSHN